MAAVAQIELVNYKHCQGKSCEGKPPIELPFDNCCDAQACKGSGGWKGQGHGEWEHPEHTHPPEVTV